MKGVVSNLLEEVVTDQHGEAAWDAILESSGLAGSYTSLGSYPDAEMESLVLAASSALAMPAPEVLRWFGCQAMSFLSQRYATVFTAHQSARPFIKSVNGIIHPEVRKLYSEAHCPSFDFESEVAQLEMLGCDFGQGYVFSKPVEAAAVAKLLRAKARAGGRRASVSDLVA